jgi:tetratricopeptide (TPR) repeat protein
MKIMKTNNIYIKSIYILFVILLFNNIIEAKNTNKYYFKIYNDSGIHFLDKDEYDTAILFFEKALENDSGDIDIYSYLFELYQYENNDDSAIAIYEKAVMNFPNSIWIYGFYYELGKKYAVRREFKKAIHNFESIVCLKKNLFIDTKILYNSYYLLGTIYGGAYKNHHKAINNLKKAISLNPNLYEPYFAMGLNYMALNKSYKAIEMFEKVLELDGTVYDAYFYLTPLLRDTNQPDKIIKYYNKSKKYGF